jgi:hypothetical protein
MLKIVRFFIILFIIPIHFATAQTTSTDVDESFDPFADYNEFEQQTEEEADINFLRNGRYLTLAFITGYRGYIGGGFSQAYTGNIDYGAEFTYFFDMQIAASLSYITGDHAVAFQSYNDPDFTSISRPYTGSVNIQMLDFHIKYYFNTDNVTKGLADLNPYGLIGTGYYVRSYSLNENLGLDPDKVVGFKLAAGIEIPLLRRRAYLGLQSTYRYVQFPDENNGFIDESGDTSTEALKPVQPRLNGDIFEINVILGMNF